VRTGGIKPPQVVIRRVYGPTVWSLMVESAAEVTDWSLITDGSVA
jgi:hypothetical protein